MRIDARTADSFVRKIDPKIRAVLLYGPDEGLVAERSATASRSICADLGDPFRVVEIGMTTLREDPARLADEFAAMSLMGGRRVVRVRPAGEEILPALENLLEARNGDALIVIEAGDLRPTSGLRRLAESSDTMAAIGCYADSDAALGSLLDRALRQAGLGITAEARDWVIDNLGGDRGQTRSEIDKLILFKGTPQAGESAKIELEEAMAILGDTAELGVDAVVQATWGGDLLTLDRALDRLFAEGTSPIQILRGLQRHGTLLQLATDQLASGMAPEAIAATVRPPLHFSRKAQFLQQLRLWTAQRCARALTSILEAEIDCKSTGLPDRSIARRLCLQLAAAARRAQAPARRR